jgi:putative nucleotidyltransferase with HDIG domain
MISEKVLIVEENNKRREYLTRFLSKHAFDIELSSSFSEAINRLQKQQEFTLIVAGLSPISSHNLKVLHHIKKVNPQLSLIILFESKSPELAISLINQGLVDHIADPDNLPSIYSAIKNEINKKDLIRENESYLQSLKKISSDRTDNIRKALELENIYNMTIENLMTALDLRDVETLGHSKTVAKYSEVLAEISGIKNKTTLENIRRGALLHDIGKIAIPDSILLKPSELSAGEWEKIRLHPALGFGLIKEIKLLKEAGNIILYHHERFDGNGYPKGLKKEEIPLEARIFALSDTLDAITSHRPYRKENSFEKAKEEITKNSKSQFDPHVVEYFCSLNLNKWEKIRFETTKFLPSFDVLQEMRKEMSH